MNSADVIHMFAQRTQSEGRCINVFFEYNRIYSYGRHYLLGEFIELNGRTIIHINKVSRHKKEGSRKGVKRSFTKV